MIVKPVDKYCKIMNRKVVIERDTYEIKNGNASNIDIELPGGRCRYYNEIRSSECLSSGCMYTSDNGKVNPFK